MPDQNDNQDIQCPRCGSEQYSVQHAGGGTSTFLLCKKCGYKAAVRAWKKRMEIGDSFEMAFNLRSIQKKAESGIGGTDQLPSSKVPDSQKYKGKRTVEFGKEEYLKEEDPEEMRAPYKTKKAKAEAENMSFNLKKLSEKTIKPFNMKKIAREFKLTDQQIERKNLGDNMVFPEGKLTGEEGEGGATGKGKGYDENRRFDTVDRKDMHKSPDPKDIIPGYKEWYDREVDKYYDGWLDDHIENSGGKVVGSNTEKMMNLDEGERYHAPEYPREAITEKLLESRHKFDDDYTRVIAEKQGKALTSQVNDVKKK